MHESKLSNYIIILLQLYLKLTTKKSTDKESKHELLNKCLGITKSNCISIIRYHN